MEGIEGDEGLTVTRVKMSSPHRRIHWRMQFDNFISQQCGVLYLKRCLRFKWETLMTKSLCDIYLEDVLLLARSVYFRKKHHDFVFRTDLGFAVWPANFECMQINAFDSSKYPFRVEMHQFQFSRPFPFFMSEICQSCFLQILIFHPKAICDTIYEPNLFFFNAHCFIIHIIFIRSII